MSKFKGEVVHLPNIKITEISRPLFFSKIKAAFPYVVVDLDDNYYFSPSWDDWAKVLDVVQNNLPKYVPEKFDCDNFAFYVSVMCSRYFDVNTCGVVEGVANAVPHKWNLIFDGDSFTQLESQRKVQFFEPNDPLYVPREVLFF